MLFYFCFSKCEVMRDKTKSNQLDKGNNEEEIKHLKGRFNV